MLELQHGHVVCINSILSQSPIPGVIDYCTSKSSSLAFMESLTLGLLDCPGVGCTTVLPFHTSTEMFQGMRVRYAELFVLTSPPSVMCWKTFSLQIWSDFLPTPRCGNGVLIVKALCLFSIYNSVLVGNHMRMSLPFMVTEVPSFICFCALKQFYFICRFPQLFPPLRPEVVAQRTVDAVRADKAFLYLPWTMHALVILKRWIKK